jgi:hypothetical protein
MLHPRPEGSFAQETGDRGLVEAQALAQDFHGNFAMFRVSCTVNGRGSAFTDAVKERVTGQRCAYERVARHAGEANGHRPAMQARFARRSRGVRAVFAPAAERTQGTEGFVEV